VPTLENKKATWETPRWFGLTDFELFNYAGMLLRHVVENNLLFFLSVSFDGTFLPNFSLRKKSPLLGGVGVGD